MKQHGGTSTFTDLYLLETLFIQFSNVVCNGYLYHHWFQQVLGEENREAESVLEGALTAAMAVFDATASECWSQVVRVIVKECQVSLAHIRSITQTYRMTNKPAPVKHSAFVPSILHPLKEMLGGWGSMLSDEKRDKLVTAVGEQVSEAYRVKAGELLVAVRKLEKTLAKHRRRAVKRIAGTEADVSDADKMCLQLVLDVKEFGKLLSGVGADIGSCKAYALLLTEVTGTD